MPIKISKKPVLAPEEPATETTMPTAQDLKGTAAKLAALVQEHGTLEFEGFKWLATTIDGVAGHLGVHRNTIRKIIEKTPFRYITRNTKDDGRHILLRIGAEPCETDHVFMLRAIWAKGLIVYNHFLAQDLTMEVMHLKQTGANEKCYERLGQRISAAEKGAKDYDRLKAGKRVPLQVLPPHMGQLRGIIQVLGEDAENVTAYLVTHVGWARFMSYIKADELETKYLHWPFPGLIKAHPDLALQAYLDGQQEKGNIELSESYRLIAKIDKMKPKGAA